MKHLRVCQKYYSARGIFNSLLSVSSDDETLCQMLNIIFTRSSLKFPWGAKKSVNKRKWLPTERVRAESSNRLLLRRS